jgi:GTP:adenosylcobinamide-phosphate guanylyltransferase
VLLAGDRGASRAVHGQSKAFVEVGGKPMVVHVLETLLHTPEVSEVFIVGDAIRLEKTIAEFGSLQLATARAKPVHIVPQWNSLYENIWHTFLRTLPEGSKNEEHGILVVPTDIPLAVPEEISDFTRQALATGYDYVIGISPAAALLPFAPEGEQADGIVMASFNLAEGRYRQSNLHYVKPLKMGNRHYIQDMYENRYQKELGSMLRLGFRILRKEFRNLWVVFYYALMHMAGVLDRRGHQRAADRVRSWVSLRTVELGISDLLRTRATTVVTALGGAALDVDNDADLEALDKHLESWKAMQVRLARHSGLSAGTS